MWRASLFPLIPAQAGIQYGKNGYSFSWVPAFAGTSGV
jgi:hypothetical protein